LLYKKRKIDFRCFMLLTQINGYHKGYWFEEGYIRTSSENFSLANINNRYIHLTNDAVQKYGDNFSKFEYGNKVSFNGFQ
jgi:tubulin polyglutamylase TTLL1/tubulin monoglycylase TTLL3/8